MMKPRKKAGAHVVVGDINSCWCLNCGDEYKFNPGSIGVIAAIFKAYSKDHRRCRPSEAGRKRFEFNTPEEWIRSWDTGVSSKTIWAMMMGKAGTRGEGSIGGTPRDPSDFGRCYRLLAKFPEWTARLSEVSARFVGWEPYVAAWSELTALYEEELPQGTAPKLYARLKQLAGEGMDAHTP